MLVAIIREFNRIMEIYGLMRLILKSYGLVNQRKTMAGGTGKSPIVALSSDRPTPKNKIRSRLLSVCSMWCRGVSVKVT